MGSFAKLVLFTGLLGACGEVVDPNARPDAPPSGSDAAADAPANAVTIQIAPEMPRTLDDLVASVTAGEMPATATWRWTLNGTERVDLTTETVANDQTTKGEVWKVELLDGTEVLATTEVTIQNSPPSAPTVTYSSATPTASLPFRCIATGSVDDDGDPITYAASWTQNGNAFASTSTTTFPADTVGGAFTKVSDVFRCTVAASDGTDMTIVDGDNAAAMACRVYGTSTTLNPNGTGSTGTIQTFTIPAGVCSVRIEVAGAKGGVVTTQAGKGMNNNGARMIGTFAVTEGSALKVLVGQLPTGGPYAGGGGTFVTTMTNTPMIIAGGGGSNFCSGGGCTISDVELMGRIVTSGGTTGGVARADNGQGGNIFAGSFAGAGAGLLTNGQGATPALAFVNGGGGGGSPTDTGNGGFGGGGGRNGTYGEGGGGGYSGGSCANNPNATNPDLRWLGCGGGGSYNNGASPSNTAGINTGAGYARFTY